MQRHIDTQRHTERDIWIHTDINTHTDTHTKIHTEIHMEWTHIQTQTHIHRTQT